MSIQSAREYQFCFSLNKQSDARTAIVNAKLNKCRMLRAFAPITQQRTNITDRNWYGKGHPFPTFVDPVQFWYQIPAAERSASSLDLLYAAAYVMGQVQTTQPDSALLQYQHVVNFQDLTLYKECLYTTVGEIMGSEYKKKLSGAIINQFTITGNRADHVLLSFEGQGRYYVDGTFDVPNITTASFYKTLYGRVSFGPSAGISDISAQVLSFTLTLNQNPQQMFLMGNSVGEEALLTKLLIGDQTISGNVVIFVDATMRDYFLNTDEVALRLVLESPDLCCLGGARQSCTIDLPHMIIQNEAFGLEGTTVSYTLGFPDGSILKKGSDDPVTMTFISDISDAELLVAA